MKRLTLTFALAILALPATADDFGRLFFTPEQRARLDSQHTRSIEDSGSSSVLTVNGIVQREGGPRTVWINGVPRDAGRSVKHDPASVPVVIPGHSSPIKIKVGQKLRLEDVPEPPAAPR